MDLMNLFRDEAVEYQRSKLVGDVILYVPAKYSIIIGICAFIIFLVGVFLVTQEYVTKQRVSGFLIPSSGLTKISVDQPSTIRSLYVSVGDDINQREHLMLVSTEKNSSTGINISDEMFQSFEREKNKIQHRIDMENNNLELKKHHIELAIQNIHGEIDSNRNELKLLENSVKISNLQHEKLKKLAQNGFASKAHADSEELNLIQYQQQLNNLSRAIESKVKEIEIKRNEINLEQIRSQDMISSLSQRNEQINQQQITISNIDGQVIRSPVEGIITSIFEQEGSYLMPGNIAIVIQSRDDPLIAKLAVPSKSIGLIVEDQQVAIYFDAFPYQRFGIFRGTVTKISRNIISPREFSGPLDTPESFYFVDVALNKQYIEAYGKRIPLIAGMKLDAEIALERNTLFEWIISPLKSIARKLR